jgi:hypothetical protein
LQTKHDEEEEEEEDDDEERSASRTWETFTGTGYSRRVPLTEMILAVG